MLSPLIRRFLLQISSNFSSPFNHPGMVPLAGVTFDDKQEYVMIGTNPVPLHPKNRLLPFSISCNNPSSSGKQHPELPTIQAKPRRGDNNCFESSSSSSSSLLRNQALPAKNYTSRRDESLQRGHFGNWKNMAASAYRPHNYLPMFRPYDICFHGKQRNPALMGDMLHEKNRGSCIGLQEEGAKERMLRPGMVLLKRYITHDEQVEIVKICCKLGLGPGGFYRPGYADGAKLRLQMMCLGLDWDPQTRKYGNKRLVDGSKPHGIPHNFSELVVRAIQDAHCLIKRECGVSYVEDILPSISPDICIVNFYNTNGSLGLHRDRDESRESLQKGLPVVSFSIGDSAEFLYGDQRHVEKAGNVLLESGDVLIFGGESRHVYHGVSSIIPDSAPNELLKDTLLSPGRLNLTFRQY